MDAAYVTKIWRPNGSELRRVPRNCVAPYLLLASPNETALLILDIMSGNISLLFFFFFVELYVTSHARSTGALKFLRGHSGQLLTSTTLEPFGYLVTAAADHTVRLWQVTAQKCVRCLRNVQIAPGVQVIAKGGSLFLVQNSEIVVWNLM
jgi:WD40 repeat protein